MGLRRRTDRAREADAAARERLGLTASRVPRRRILTPRGRITLAVLGALFLLAALVAVPIGTPTVDRRLRTPAEGAAPAAPGGFERAPRQAAVGAPMELLARVPYSRAALELGRTGPPPVDEDDTRARPVTAARPIDPGGTPRLVEWVAAPQGFAGPLRVEYALDADLTERVFRVLERARVQRGHAVVLDVRSGRVLAYASADPEALPPTGAYPAASLAKVVTAAASLEHDRARALVPCRYRGDPYRLTKARVNPARGGHVATLERALARSYNQCFAQLAVHALGDEETQRAFERFRWNLSPAPGHSAGKIDRGEGVYGLGKLGSGLAASRITALHAAQLAGALRTGEIVEPWWIDRIVDRDGRALALPERGLRHRVMERDTADEMRRMLVLTTTRGTARSAFRTRRGPLLGPVRVSGKTGNLSGSEPRARYEWFAGVAPADDPVVAVAVVQAHGHLWWKMSAQIAADVFAELFCERRACSAGRVARFTGEIGSVVRPALLGPGAAD